MDLKVVWSPEAIEDVESIAEYIGRDSEFYARAAATKIIQMARSIESFSRSRISVNAAVMERILVGSGR